MSRNPAYFFAIVIVMVFIFAETLIIQGLGGPSYRGITVPVTMLIAGIAGWHITNLGRLLEKKEK